MVSNQLTSSILIEQKAGKAIFHSSVKYPTNTITPANQKGFGQFGQLLKVKRKCQTEALENGQRYYCFYFRMDDKVTQVLQCNQNQDKYIDTQELIGNFWPVDLKALHHDCRIQSSSCFDLVSNAFQQTKIF